MRHSTLLIAVPALLAAAPAWAATNFAGTYSFREDGIETKMVLLQTANGQVTGTISDPTAPMRLSGTVDGDRVVGTVSLGTLENALKFEIVRTGGKVRFSLMDEKGKPDPDSTIDFTRVGGAPVAPTVPKPPAEPATPKTGVKPSGGALPNPKTYTHPSGVTMQYPGNWSLQEGSGFLSLIPPDRGKNTQGPTEAYLVLGESVPGINDARDPRVLQQADAVLAQMMPFLKRVGAPEDARAEAGAGVHLKWEGTNSMGKAILAHGYIVVQKGFAVSVLGVGEKERVTPREATVRAIFASIAAKAADTEGTLVGTWHMLKDGGQMIRDAGGKVTTSTASDRNITYQLAQDGTCVMVEKSHFIAGSGGVFIDSGPTTETKRGRWNGGKGKLFLQWEDGSTSTHAYRFADGKLIVDEKEVFSRQ